MANGGLRFAGGSRHAAQKGDGAEGGSQAGKGAHGALGQPEPTRTGGNVGVELQESVERRAMGAGGLARACGRWAWRSHTGARPQNQFRQGHFHRTGVGACPAESAEIREVAVIFRAEEAWRDHDADGAGVGGRFAAAAHVGVPADFLKHRACVQACPAANAAQGVGQRGLRHPAAAIVYDDQVTLGGRVGFAFPPRAVDEGGVNRQVLAGG